MRGADTADTSSSIMSPLLDEMDRVITGIARLNRQSAYAALEAVFGGLKARYDVLSEAEVAMFAELVHLVLLQFARGETIRVSGPRQPHELDVCLKYNDVYEAALHRAMEFLSRNLIDHLEKYSPQQYLRAALRVLGKEYYNVLMDSYHTDSIPEESAALREDEPGQVCGGAEDAAGGHEGAVFEEALAVVGPEEGSAAPHRHGAPAGPAAEQQMFYNWYEGNLSRRELTQLYGLTTAEVDRSLLSAARSYEGGRHYGMVKWLIELGEDGDIIWLLSKGMTAADVGQKIHRNQWVVYKHRDAVLKRFEALRLNGAEGRAFCARLFGLQSDTDGAERVSRSKPESSPKAALRELAAQVSPG